jgi:hypothetical protein
MHHNTQQAATVFNSTALKHVAAAAPCEQQRRQSISPGALLFLTAAL